MVVKSRSSRLGLLFICLLIGWVAPANAQVVKVAAVARNYTLDDRVQFQLWNYSWRPNTSEPITKLVVHLKEQRVYVYQGEQIAAWSPITTGKPGHETPTGHFSVILKDIDHTSNLYGQITDSHGNVIDSNATASMKVGPGQVYDSAHMPYYLRITEDGVGFHSGYLPGYPASHGCIRLPHAFAELLYWNVAAGTPVDVEP